MLEKLSINELDSYLRLCERNLEFIDTKRRLNPTSQTYSYSHNISLIARNRLYEEINKRLEKLLDEDEESAVQ